MYVQCKTCQCRVLIPEDTKVLIDCAGDCLFNCEWLLDHETYPHGEEVQHWIFQEEEDG